MYLEFDVSYFELESNNSLSNVTLTCVAEPTVCEPDCFDAKKEFPTVDTSAKDGMWSQDDDGMHFKIDFGSLVDKQVDERIQNISKGK